MLNEHILVQAYARYVLPLGPVKGIGKLLKFLLSLAPVSWVFIRLCAAADLPLFEYKLICGYLRVTNQRLLFQSLPEETEDLEFCILLPSIITCTYVPKLFGLHPNLVVNTSTRAERFIVRGADWLKESIMQRVCGLTQEDKTFIIQNYLTALGAGHGNIEKDLEAAFWDTASLIERDSHWTKRQRRFIRKNLMDVEQLLPSLTNRALKMR
jgi:hypothetical protein